MMKIINLCWAILPVLLSSCAAMTLDECKTANWAVVGEKDGSNGQERRLDQYYKACSKANIVPNQSQYEQGYRKGQGYYCQPDYIFYEALKGNGNYQVCPVETHSKLISYYEIAHDYYNAENEYERYQDNFKDYTRKSYDDKLKPEDRERYRKLLKDLQNDSDRINRDYRDAIRDLEKFKYQHGLK
ncbi:DUF2799 domain-containing protein [Acinetobacter sp. S40]|uniref:DUF2799 domain-containing protein n=1 Tax=Acinetobacter sp. S40 TaxID=2767434 RepID=UPI001909F6EC|nr:DUF2799 domain-containing protein [Acinetobacter sp. S40]